MSDERPTPDACEPIDEWVVEYAPPELDLEPLTGGRAWTALRDGERFADVCEEALTSFARVRGAIDVAIGEGLSMLQRGDRLAELGYHLGDYAREVLGIAPTTAYGLVRFARGLRDRPILRRAVHRGEVLRSAAERVLPVAKGTAEGYWVCRARALTVRALAVEVEKARSNLVEAEQEFVRFRVRCSPEDRALIDEALELAGELLPGSTRAERLEAMAQEFIGSAGAFLAGDGEGERVARVRERRAEALERRRAQLETETERWAILAHVDAVEAPAVDWHRRTTARSIDNALRKLAGLRRQWDDRVGRYALMLRRSGLHVRNGFADFRQYCEERLGLSPRTVEQRAALEERLWAVPALRAARDAGVTYEKLRVLARLPDGEIPARMAHASEVTAIALQRELEAETERQMSARGRLSVSVPESTDTLLATALETVRAVAGRQLDDGKCLALIAQHFLETWKDTVDAPRTLSQRVRERDAGRCLVPGCSHRAMHAHHRKPRAQGGSDDLHNLLSTCVYHHLRCIHGGYLRVRGTAPDALTWWRGAERFTGMPS